MRWFTDECDLLSKKYGKVPDLIDLGDNEKDALIANWLLSIPNIDAAAAYRLAGNESKNKMYSQYEFKVQAAIDEYNNDRNIKKSMDREITNFIRCRPTYQIRQFQDMEDAGHKFTDF